MEFLTPILDFLNTTMETPTPYGWFHLMWWVITIAFAIGFSIWHRNRKDGVQRKVLLITTLIVIALEIYKQVIISYAANWNYPWYIFPLQFCSTPMYVGLLAALTKKGKIHRAACAYMASFSLFAGTAVMFLPITVFTPVTGVNIQTMVCHGSMIFLGIYLMATGYVKPGIKTVLRALPIFAVILTAAMLLNEHAHQVGISEGFNMFFISPYGVCELPVLNMVQAAVPHWVFVLVYTIGFVVVAYVMQLLAMLVRLVAKLIRLIFFRKKASV